MKVKENNRLIVFFVRSINENMHMPIYVLLALNTGVRILSTISTMGW